MKVPSARRSIVAPDVRTCTARTRSVALERSDVFAGVVMVPKDDMRRLAALSSDGAFVPVL
jgi:hypothetical protein